MNNKIQNYNFTQSHLPYFFTVIFLLLCIQQINTLANPIRYECTDTEVIGFTGIFDDLIEAQFFMNNNFQIEIDPINEQIKTLTDIRERLDSDGQDDFTKAQCESIGNEEEHFYTICSDHFGQIMFNYSTNEYTRTYHSGLLKFTDYILLGYGQCNQIDNIEILPGQIVG